MGDGWGDLLVGGGFWASGLFVGASLLANGSHLWRRCFEAIPFPLPNPLPEGRGDRWAETGITESAGNSGVSG
ncbi:hypothetical protein PCLA_03f0028 [Pseudomonas citronellolis]|nr:hypothetical protein PCLA_03f0028 [Pseudomonas citronellolis]